MDLSAETQELITQLAKEGFNNGTNAYFLIEKITYNVLKLYYEDEQEIKFPIDIRGIIKAFEIEIMEMDLNVDSGFRIDRVNGYLRSPYGQNGWRIYIDYDDSEFTKRYMLAHEFSHYLLRICTEPVATQENVVDYCIDPMLPKKWDELYTDIMAAYFLLPYRSLIEEMAAYADWMKSTNNYPIDAVQLMRTVGNRAQISSYHTFMSYQYRKYYFCYLYNEIEDGEIREWLKKYEMLFK